MSLASPNFEIDLWSL